MYCGMAIPDCLFVSLDSVAHRWSLTYFHHFIPRALEVCSIPAFSLVQVRLAHVYLLHLSHQHVGHINQKEGLPCILAQISPGPFDIPQSEVQRMGFPIPLGLGRLISVLTLCIWHGVNKLYGTYNPLPHITRLSRSSLVYIVGKTIDG